MQDVQARRVKMYHAKIGQIEIQNLGVGLCSMHVFHKLLFGLQQRCFKIYVTTSYTATYL